MKLSSAVFFALAGPAFAINDWSTPCHSGQCSWHMPDTGANSFGVMHVWGSPMAIADITPAAGWSILGCSATAASQDIRIACTNPDAECGHLLQSNAVGRIVRLPDECGPAPFSRISAISLSEDQLVPTHLRRRHIPSPKVHMLSLSDDFSGDSPHGPVNFAVHLTSSPNIDTSAIAPPSLPQHSSRSIREHRERQTKERFVRDSVHSFLTRDFSFDGNDFDVNDQIQTFDPITVDKTGNIFNVSVDNCKIGGVPFDAAVSADATVTATATVSLGFSAAGQLLPVPKLESAALTAGLSGNVDGSLHITASADGTFSSPSLTLFEFPLPGDIGIPGVINLGPVFKVVANADLTLSTGIDTVIGLSYSVDNATLVFPPTAGPSSGHFTATDSPLSISTDTNVTGDAAITAHVIPQLSVGLTVFGDQAAATVTLSLDASATLDLNGTAGVRTETGSDAVILPPTGCVDVSAGLNVAASADATLLQIFEAGDSVSLFKKDFDLFSTCGAADLSGLRNSTQNSADSGSMRSSNATMSSNSTSSANSTSSVNSTSSESPTSTAVSDGYMPMHAYASSLPPAMHHTASSQPPSSPYTTSSSPSYPSSTSVPSADMTHSSSTWNYTPSSYYTQKRTPTLVLGKRAEFSCPSLPFSIKAPPSKPATVVPIDAAAR